MEAPALMTPNPMATTAAISWYMVVSYGFLPRGRGDALTTVVDQVNIWWPRSEPSYFAGLLPPPVAAQGYVAVPPDILPPKLA